MEMLTRIQDEKEKKLYADFDVPLQQNTVIRISPDAVM